MKKLIFFCCLFYICLLNSNVKAADQDYFEATLKCDAGYVPAASFNGFVGMSGYEGEVSYNKSVLEKKQVCVNTSTVSQIFDVDALGSVNEVAFYCKAGSITGFDTKLNGYGTRERAGFSLAGGRGPICCDTSHPYIRHPRDEQISLEPYTVCCADPGIYGGVSRTCGINSSGIAIQGKPPIWSEYAEISIFQNTNDFKKSTGTSYFCATDKCMVVNKILIASSGDRYVTDKTNASCTLSYKDDASNVYCIEGASVSKSDYETYITIGAGATNACNDFQSDSSDRTNCLDCYKKCNPSGSCSYSSLGCIQTTQNGMIIRIFQIGLGVVGALAIARFIQAALLRQTADPSKIQESYDIITSIIIGIVVLLGSTVILRFVGVDILQMLPF